MTKQRILFWSMLLVAVVFATYRYSDLLRTPADKSRSASSEREAPEEEATAPIGLSKAIADPDAKLEPDEKSTKTQDDCLNPSQLETHPMFSSEMARLDAVVTSGPTIASYRGLSSAALHDIAMQGDSAAMAVLGAVSVMRARNLPEDQAVPFLLFEDLQLHRHAFSRPPDAETEMHYEEAQHWFYQAALRGRLLALYHVGDILGIVKGGPVELGWIKQDDYDALNQTEKNGLLPSNVYNATAFEIAPQLRDGPFGESGIFSTPRTEHEQLIIEELAVRFDLDRKGAKLPPITVAESAAPSLDQIQAMLCEDYREDE